ncbi:relaxase/mobilization nuclease domain-containing protein [Sulfitobacter sp. KE34]|uniref:relaxase/mobilization nuclease domain-containing protein n=1 Tax=unclassified Sulfitobacter TaxID=196795 RepID=UPI0023E0DA62|nr:MULTISPECIES: relaxase/mobilization nuclease domain-containing protein [unclassified Sulfitobacter]MDF3351599.1 relaxase/mobilization nuclease domain-containing protein [Sulfitobacter sp. KE12]MDF3355272.1 relaxase/mobilization nuclease domain-containing protein [Sulfitobacter sp. KE27]MDF3358920.1 relaxase/mobilization nuclease domain-containing protein [Sulfitobacter sp. KE33]MDF3366344.1 relaxase/mobilization nuclease domain-containing protein [Sulfitobacter sp. Ks34]MDF3369953.1 relaxas
MIAKVVKGADFHGLLSYLTHSGRGEILDRHNLSATDPEAVAGEMWVAARLSRRVRKPVLHCSLSYGPGENPTEEQMRADAREALRGLGLARHQAIVVRHRDKDHTHIHVAANRVGADGRAVHDGHSYAKLETVLREIEKKRGWRAVQGRHAPGPDGLRMSGPSKRPDPRQSRVPDAVRSILLEARTWQDLHAGLASAGWKLEIKQRPGKKPGALLIGPKGEKIAAGKVDRTATLAQLKARLSSRAATPSKSLTPKKKKSGNLTRHTERSVEMLLNGLLATTGNMASLNRKKPLLSAPPRRRRVLTRLATPSLSHLPRMR